MRAARLLVLFGLAKTAAAQPFASQAGTSGALDVPDAYAMPLGAANVEAELRAWSVPQNPVAIGPAAALGLGLSHGLELGLSLREGGRPGDTAPSTLLIASSLKLHLLDSGALAPGAPAIALQADLDRINVSPQPDLRAVAATPQLGPVRLMAFAGVAYLVPRREVVPMAGAAAVFTFAERYEGVFEGEYGPIDSQVGGALRWRISDRLGLSVGVARQLQARATLFTLAFSFSTTPPPRKRSPEEEQKPVAPPPPPPKQGPAGFTDARPRFRLKVKLNQPTREAASGGRHLQYGPAVAEAQAPAPAPAPAAPARVPAPAPAPAPQPVPVTAPAPAPQPLVVITSEKLVIRDQIFFVTGKATIQPRSYPLLEQVAAVLQQHPELALVRVEGHTDSVGGAAYNRKLSQDRAESVRRFLLGKGVAPERLEAKGFGLERPVASNLSSAGRSANRRVEFSILPAAAPAVAAAAAPSTPLVAEQVTVRVPGGGTAPRAVSQSLLLELQPKASSLTAPQRAALRAFAEHGVGPDQGVLIEVRAPEGAGKLAEASRRAEEIEAQLSKTLRPDAHAIAVEVVRVPQSKRIAVVVYAVGPPTAASPGQPQAAPAEQPSAPPAPVGPPMGDLLDAVNEGVIAGLLSVPSNRRSVPAANPPGANSPAANPPAARSVAVADAGIAAASTVGVVVDAGVRTAAAPDAGPPVGAPIDAGARAAPPAVGVALDPGVAASAARDAGPAVGVGARAVAAPDAGPAVGAGVRAVAARDAGPAVGVGARAVAAPDAGPAVGAGVRAVAAPDAGPAVGAGARAVAAPDAGPAVGAGARAVAAPDAGPAIGTGARAVAAPDAGPAVGAGARAVAAPDAGRALGVVDAGAHTVAAPDAGPALGVVDAGARALTGKDAGPAIGVVIDAGARAVAAPDAGSAASVVIDAGARAVAVPDAGPAVGVVDAGPRPVAAPDAGPASVAIKAGARALAAEDAGSAPATDAGIVSTAARDAGFTAKGADAGSAGASSDRGRTRDAGRPDAGQPIERLKAGTEGEVQLKACVLSHLGEIRRCVEGQLKRTPKLRASGLLRITVDRKGCVSQSAIEAGPLKGTHLESCVREDAAAWRFPAGTEPYELEVPLNVTSVERGK